MAMCVFMVRLAEGLVHFLAAGGVIADFPTHLVEHFSWPRFLSIQVWLMVLFLVYVTTHELNMLIGDGELYRLFFRWRSSEAKLTRRQRIRLLTRLNRLTEANPIEAFSDRGSPAHAELVDILHQLASPRRTARRVFNERHGLERLLFKRSPLAASYITNTIVRGVYDVVRNIGIALHSGSGSTSVQQHRRANRSIWYARKWRHSTYPARP